MRSQSSVRTEPAGHWQSTHMMITLAALVVTLAFPGVAHAQFTVPSLRAERAPEQKILKDFVAKIRAMHNDSLALYDSAIVHFFDSDSISKYDEAIRGRDRYISETSLCPT